MTIHHGDCLDVMRGMEPGSVDAVVTDPPYGLAFMGKDWDHGLPGVHFWEAARDVLKPSHYLLAFGGTRTWHRLACAIEDAGFEIRDTLMWLYGSGFPKGKACLKPAWEPIILARKPGPMRELGIEECRVGTTKDVPASPGGRTKTDPRCTGAFQNGQPTDSAGMDPASGRWPANLVLDEEAAPDEDWTRYFYCAKASRAERNAGCEGMEERAPAFNSDKGDGLGRGISHTRQDWPRANHHPTVKPVALMRWLVRLVARPGDVVLDPFMGSGTTGVACAMESRNFVGIEREAEYVEIARRRIDAASRQGMLSL